jgi:hypothetical protein
MPWPVVSVQRSRKRTSLGGVLSAGLLTLVWLTPVGAVDTNIGVSICGDDSPGASIAISEPNDDSLVSTNMTRFRASVSNASQVEISLDGQYVTTLAIGATQTSLQTDLTLEQGTHTIAMTALDICNGQSATDTVVITYQPAVEPSSGVTTPTEIVSDQSADGVVITTDQLEDEEASTPEIEQLPIVGPIVNGVTDFTHAIGLNQTLAGSGAPLAVGVARVALTAAAVTSVVMAASLAPLALQAAPGLTEVFHAGSHRSMMYLEWAIRGVGVLAMAIAYFI